MVCEQRLEWWNWIFSPLLFQVRRQNSWLDWCGWMVKLKTRSTNLVLQDSSGSETSVTATEFHCVFGECLWLWWYWIIEKQKISPKAAYTLHIAMERDILDLLILYLLYIKFLEMCYHFFSLMLVILLKLLRVNMDKSYWITELNVHVLFRWTNVGTICNVAGLISA